MTELDAAFYAADGPTLARALLGKVLVKRTGEGISAAVITETEAYMGISDRASHAYGGRRTARTETMYLPGGHAYVYLIYGLYSCMNVTAAGAGNPEAVLIRAAYPIAGLDGMLARVREKSRRKKPLAAETDADRYGLLRGPGRLCLAMGITRADDARPLTAEEGFFFADIGLRPRGILCRPRIGIDYAKEARDLPWRFTAAEEGGLPVFSEPLPRDGEASALFS